MKNIFYTVFNKKSLKYKDYVFKTFEKFNIYNTSDIESCDVIFTIGGDGTILPVVQKALYYNKPIMGYNLTGHMGFLTCGKDLGEILFDYINNKLYKSKRMIAAFEVNGETYYFLNEAYIKCNSDHLTKIDVLFQERNFISEINYECDGLIVSTPTGSTGYNMSAGGPIILPDMVSAFSITANAPFGLSSRPIIIPTDIDFIIKSKRELLINFDNVNKIITKEISYKGFICNIILYQNDGFINNIKNKLHWCTR